MVISMVILFLGAGASPVWSPQPIAQCENVFQLSESVYSGGEPQGEAAWSALAERGIKTIVSVDSARPDVEAAKRHGLRYIHLPIGYDGFSRERVLQFGRILTDIDGPVYFHCHHGKHRGPAAGWTAPPDHPDLSPPHSAFPVSSGLPRRGASRYCRASFASFRDRWCRNGV